MINRTIVPYQQIWVPDTVLYNSEQMDRRSTEALMNAIVEVPLLVVVFSFSSIPIHMFVFLRPAIGAWVFCLLNMCRDQKQTTHQSQCRRMVEERLCSWCSRQSTSSAATWTCPSTHSLFCHSFPHSPFSRFSLQICSRFFPYDQQVCSPHSLHSFPPLIWLLLVAPLPHCRIAASSSPPGRMTVPPSTTISLVQPWIYSISRTTTNGRWSASTLNELR